jgi:hypothetical protein
MATEHYTQAALAAQAVAQQIRWREWQTTGDARWRLAYDALVSEAHALRAEFTEVRADLDTLRADLASAD